MKKTRSILILTSVVFFTVSASANNQLSNAFKSCVNQATEKQRFVIKKTKVDGTNDTYLTISCSGETAEKLYISSEGYGVEHEKYWSDGDLVRSRYMGRGSGCYRRIENANREPVNHYWCHIKISIYNSIIKALNL